MVVAWGMKWKRKYTEKRGGGGRLWGRKRAWSVHSLSCAGGQEGGNQKRKEKKIWTCRPMFATRDSFQNLMLATENEGFAKSPHAFTGTLTRTMVGGGKWAPSRCQLPDEAWVNTTIQALIILSPVITYAAHPLHTKTQRVYIDLLFVWGSILTYGK